MLGAVQIHFYTSRGGVLGPCKKKWEGGGPDQGVILHHFFKRKFQQEKVRKGEGEKEIGGSVKMLNLEQI